jgi:hypothetical protein
MKCKAFSTRSPDNTNARSSVSGAMLVQRRRECSSFRRCFTRQRLGSYTNWVDLTSNMLVSWAKSPLELPQHELLYTWVAASRAQLPTWGPVLLLNICQSPTQDAEVTEVNAFWPPFRCANKVEGRRGPVSMTQSFQKYAASDCGWALRYGVLRAVGASNQAAPARLG